MFSNHLSNNLESAKKQLRPTRSVYYFISSASRPSISTFYNELITQKVVPPHFPHDKQVHSGIFIYNHLSEKVEDVIEGSGNREQHLVLYRNRQSTINKLENSGALPGQNKNLNVPGYWKMAYQIEIFFLTKEIDLTRLHFDKFFQKFNAASLEHPIPYKIGSIDCQTCTHFLIKQITKKTYPSPHGEYTMGWSDGNISPMELGQMLRQKRRLA